MVEGKLKVLCLKDDTIGMSEQAPQAVVTLNHVQLIKIRSHSEALEFLKQQPFDLVLYTLSPGVERKEEEALKFLRESRKMHSQPVIIMIPEKPSCREFETLMARIQDMGQFDWIIGSMEEIALFKLYDRLLSNRCTSPSRASFVKRGERYSFQGMVGRSTATIQVFSLIERLAPYDTTILITGETGTGKEMAAKAIHASSPRRSMNFVTCNCAALPEGLLESELFGHLKGAFTGATQQREGLFRHSHGGTIFLDEIGHMPLELQAKLLRVIEQKEIRPVGSDRTQAVDTRIVAATNRDLWHAVLSGSFRKDLFYRLNVARIEIPPLRERVEDIPILCHYFLEQINRKHCLPLKGCSEDAMRLLMHYDWPGNIRELKNSLETAALMATGDLLAIRDLPQSLQEYAISNQEKVVRSLDRLTLLEAREKRYIQEVMSHCGGNKTDAAAQLGLSRRSLYRRLQKYQLAS